MECMELREGNINTLTWTSEREETTPNYISRSAVPLHMNIQHNYLGHSMEIVVSCQVAEVTKLPSTAVIA